MLLVELLSLWGADTNMVPYEAKGHEPGVIGFCTSGWPRIEQFWWDLLTTQVPSGTFLEKRSGTGLASMFNGIVEVTLNEPSYKWLWILGDDHTWDPTILRKLISRAQRFNCDAIAPLVCRKLPPFQSVLFTEKGQLPFHDLPETTAPIEVVRAGTAGLLVQRKVLEDIKASGEPFFREGWQKPDALGEDVWFSDMIRKTGHRIFVDPTLSIGHSPYGVSVEPFREDGVWKLRFNFPEGKHFSIVLPRPEMVAEGA